MLYSEQLIEKARSAGSQLPDQDRDAVNELLQVDVGDPVVGAAVAITDARLQIGRAQSQARRFAAQVGLGDRQRICAAGVAMDEWAWLCVTA